MAAVDNQSGGLANSKQGQQVSGREGDGRHMQFLEQDFCNGLLDAHGC